MSSSGPLVVSHPSDSASPPNHLAAVPPLQVHAKPQSAGWPWHPAVALAMLLLGVAHTWPLVDKLTTHLAGGPREDPYMNAWHLWWLKRAFDAGLNPFLTPYLHHPLGAELYWHTLSPAKTGLGIVLLRFMSAQTAYNLLLLSTFVTTGWTAWLLLRYLLSKAGFPLRTAGLAAFAGACVFNFSRYHLTHAFAHLNLSSLEGIPLYLFFFLRWMDQGRRKDLFGLALTAVYILLCDYYYLLYSALISLAWLLYCRWKRAPILSTTLWRDPLLPRAALAGGAALLACLPVLVPLLGHMSPQPLPLWHGDSDYHADVVGFFLPDRLSHWIRSVSPGVRDLVFRLDGNMEENGYFLGYTVLVAAGYGLWKGTTHGRFWLWLGISFAVLSLGTSVRIATLPHVPPALLLAAGGAVLIFVRRFRTRPWALDLGVLLFASAVLVYFVPLTAYEQPARIVIPAPYLLFKQLVPFFSRGGMPVRLELITTLSLAVLFAFGTAHAAQRPGDRGKIWGTTVCLGMALLPNWEYRGFPMDMEKVPSSPPIFEQIRQEPEGVAVFTDEHKFTQFEQMAYDKPMTYARLSRLPVREAAMVGSRLYQVLMFKRRIYEPVPAEEAAQMRAYLKEHRLKYFINHYPHPVVDAYVSTHLDGEVVHRDAERVVYRFRGVE